MCDSQTGYCLDLDVYTGKQARPSAKGFGFDVVTQLMAQHLHKGHHVYFDRFFTGVELVEFLKRNETNACGTIMLNRKNLPQEAKTLKLKKGESAFFIKNDTGIYVNFTCANYVVQE